MKAKVTSRGQVSIPSQIRRQFNIEPESRVEWIVESNVIKVVPLPKDPVAHSEAGVPENIPQSG